MRTYVQVRYPGARGWMTVASSATRDAARGAYDDFRAALGEPPSRVRIVSGAQLVREGGWRETRVLTLPWRAAPMCLGKTPRCWSARREECSLGVFAHCGRRHARRRVGSPFLDWAV
jgi:hypothetical protein